ncbi:Hypothetical protein PBC10988_38950 [Planctomycetales bacterium 10988]|nr:Hypothetical protein PBC10988_38950 [Planctomycetales bacterium 10988]
MKAIFIVFGFSMIAALTATSGWVHGELDSRWGDSQSLAKAASSFEQLPQEAGPWKLETVEPLDEKITDMLECAGSFQAAYQNQMTGEVVKVALLLGPPGPISVHTPEICYSSQSYRLLTERKAVELSFTEEETPQSCWRLKLQSKQVSGESLSVCYAWNGGDGWKASEQPRFEFAGSSYLFKLQLAAQVAFQTELEENDPCETFLKDFLPVLENHLVIPQEESSVTKEWIQQFTTN